jgi:hypothetical protein
VEILARRRVPNVVHEPQIERAVEIEILGLHHQLKRARFADETPHPLRSARPRHEAQVRLGEPDLAFASARNADIASEGNFEPAADGVAIERRDDELWRLLEAIERLVRVEAKVVFEGLIDLRKHLNVGAGAEKAVAVPGDDDDVNVVVEAGVENGFVEILHHLVREGVHRRVVQRNGGDARFRPVVDESISHGILHLSRARDYF